MLRQSDSYYNRQGATHLDGSQIFQTQADRDSEREVAQKLAEIWNCQIRKFGDLSPVDWFAERYGRMAGVLELKTRSHESGKYRTVFLNLRKWLALSLASIGSGCPAIFVVRFSDGIFWCNLWEIDPRRIRIGGCARIVKAANDIEPVIEVPTDLLRFLGT